MTLTKKHWAMLIAGLVLLFLVYWFFFKKKKTESSFSPLPLIGEGFESGYAADQLTNGRPNFESGYAMNGPVTREEILKAGHN